MREDIEFLRRKAASLRDLMQRAPELAETLGRLADELDAKADEIEAGNRRGAPDDPLP